MRGDAWRVTPQQIDPLSWFTRPLVPVAFAMLALIVGAGTIAITWHLGPLVWLDIIRWLNTGPTFPTPDDPSTCGTTIHLDRNTTVTIGCNPR